MILFIRKEARLSSPLIFSGTTDAAKILNPTRDRRFFVLRILLEDIPLGEGLKDRDKIWAAADALYRKGHKFKLTKKEEQSKSDLNKEFRKTNGWDDLIEQLWLENQKYKFKVRVLNTENDESDYIWHENCTLYLVPNPPMSHQFIFKSENGTSIAVSSVDDVELMEN